jgi:uncharacterized membrane protein YsdA (DUF1294 family)
LSIHNQLKIQRITERFVLLLYVFLIIVAMNSGMLAVWGMALFLLNAYTWLLVRKDKRLAKHSAFRIPEKTFYLLSVLGGGLGTWLAFNVYRHKTKHTLFYIIHTLLAGSTLVLFFYGWGIIAG